MHSAPFDELLNISQDWDTLLTLEGYVIQFCPRFQSKWSKILLSSPRRPVKPSHWWVLSTEPPFFFPGGSGPLWRIELWSAQHVAQESFLADIFTLVFPREMMGRRFPSPHQVIGCQSQRKPWVIWSTLSLGRWRNEVLEVILDYFLKYFCEINISYYRSILDIEKQK